MKKFFFCPHCHRKLTEPDSVDDLKQRGDVTINCAYCGKKAKTIKAEIPRPKRGGLYL